MSWIVHIRDDARRRQVTVHDLYAALSIAWPLLCAGRGVEAIEGPDGLWMGAATIRSMAGRLDLDEFEATSAARC
ncbi:MAG TPA: hypothetical protein VMB84_08505 [Stellaceae bacterium]|nr:hypothetical protein [Stellaceae bacterium]